MVEKYDISKSSTLTAAIIYDDKAKMVWKLGDALDTKSTLQRIQQLQRQADGSHVLRALVIARDEMFSENNGGRRAASKTIVLFVDKSFKVNKDYDVVTRDLKGLSVKLVVVAIGPEVDRAATSKVASGPDVIIYMDDSSTSADSVVSKAVQQTLPGTFADPGQLLNPALY